MFFADEPQMKRLLRGGGSQSGHQIPSAHAPRAKVEVEILPVLVGTRDLSLAITLTYGPLLVEFILLPTGPKRRAELDYLSQDSRSHHPTDSVLVFAASENGFTHSEQMKCPVGLGERLGPGRGRRTYGKCRIPDKGEVGGSSPPRPTINH